MRAPTDPNADPNANPNADPQPAAAPPESVLAELVELRAFRAQSQAQEAERVRAAQEAEQRRLAAQGQVDQLVQRHQEALVERDRTHREFVDRARRAERDRAVTAALAGHPLASPSAAPQLLRLLADDFECVDGPAGDFVVRAKGDYRTPAAIVAERLAHADFAHFVRAENRGGGGAGGGAPAPTRTPDPAASPATLDQAVIDDWKARGGADRKHIGLGGAPDRR